MPDSAIENHISRDILIWSLTAGANPAFIANQMGHADAQMVFQVYGKWMSENNNAQVALLNTQLSEFAPTMPHNEAIKN